jgi:hypothetical protein
VNRWEVTPPYEWWGAWEGRLQIVYVYDTKTGVCGHLHRSSAEAERCAWEVAARLNARHPSPAFRTPLGVPSDYYLG